MGALLERLERGEVILGDGAHGTMLMARGLPPGAPPETMNLTRPEEVEAVARAYREAGAELLTTNTFGGSPLMLAARGLEGSFEEVNRTGVEAALRAAEGQALVSASVGPCGCMLQPYGDADPGRVQESFRQQVDVLAAAGADCICIETMTDLAEAELAVCAAREIAPDLPVLASVTFEPTPRGFFTIMGNSVEQVVAGLAPAGAHVLGSNCGNGSDVMVELARVLRAATELPLVIQPNAGLPVQRDGALHYPEDPAFMAVRIQTLRELGVAIVGGCCGTTPAHIRAMKRGHSSLRTTAN